MERKKLKQTILGKAEDRRLTDNAAGYPVFVTSEDI
jgi:hypothetical protein